MNEENPGSTQRNLVVCLDGTSNEPEAGSTNVGRIYELASKTADQLVYYDPGVGTMGARSAFTRLGKATSRAYGFIAGYGIKENIEEAYIFLMENYRCGDSIYIFGFSRGAYTARALSGMLRTVGLLRSGSQNLVPYAVKLYAKSGDRPQGADHLVAREANAAAERKGYWKLRRDFERRFGNPDFPSVFVRGINQVEFMGIWDTVRSAGSMNVRGKFEQYQWPSTRTLDNVAIVRHAMALDERRRPFPVYRLNPEVVAASNGLHQEVWFAGIHSDVGGQYEDDHRLSDVAFHWMAVEAETAGLRISTNRYRPLLDIGHGNLLPHDRALGVLHRNGRIWVAAGGWKRRTVLPGDQIHSSVYQRIEATKNTLTPYKPNLL
ncbi:DUF2235 domain-containing protein [Antrihabitans stalagmiti]|uniref:DUF2235 domain-containing protein n=1 Tax=Antrihabitans stalagmiti TaxID=2799499 RepID=UPI0027DBAAA1|nr:DUF2235 domain-containing protein [Antrihabitans stalagmiti]